ncbi:MAG: hypothetical protein LBB81_08505 [Treponema sp.]|jgi:hypothetical protein|nr:hypothetical protein [Treponema sp.]
MVRKQKAKNENGIEALKAFETETEDEIKKYNDIRKQEFKDELNTKYYFSVVFDTKAERDQWLKERNLSLVEEIFIRAKDFNV